MKNELVFFFFLTRKIQGGVGVAVQTMEHGGESVLFMDVSATPCTKFWSNISLFLFFVFK